jgi:hypothetical protein
LILCACWLVRRYFRRRVTSDEVKSRPIMKNLSSHSGEYFILMHSSLDLIHGTYSWSTGLLIHMDQNYRSSINVELYILLNVHLGLILVNNQLDAVFSVFLFHFSTCFKQPIAHRQEKELYQYIIWYISLW